jgi:hypothetical protein
MSRAGRFVAALAVAAGLALGAPTATSRAAGTCDSHDRLCVIEAIPEADLNWTSCAQSSVAMLLESLGQVPGDSPKAKMQNVEKFVQQGGYKGDDGKYVPLGHSGNTNLDQLPHITDAAASFGIPMTSATLRVASQSGWLNDLRSKINDSGDLVITLLPSSKALWTSEKYDSGHYVVVSGITDDGQVITHDPIDGKTHIRTADAFQQAWGASKQWASPYQYLDVVPGKAPGKQAAGSKPGGTWISPAEGSKNAQIIDAAVHAYPSKAGDPAIDHVDFTVWWPELGPKTGPWKTACPAKQPASGDEYDCQIDPGNLGAPVGQVWLSFDVYDKSGASNLSPSGERAVEWTVPKDVTGGDDWQTYQGDGYFVDYPGPAQSKPLPTSSTLGIYSGDVSYYEEGANTNGEIVYMVEHISFPVSLGMSSDDYASLLKEMLAYYSMSSGDLSVSDKNVTVAGHSGLDITLQGGGEYADCQVVMIDRDLYLLMAAHYTSDTTMDAPRFFQSFQLR